MQPTVFVNQFSCPFRILVVALRAAGSFHTDLKKIHGKQKAQIHNSKCYTLFFAPIKSMLSEVNKAVHRCCNKTLVAMVIVSKLN